MHPKLVVLPLVFLSLLILRRVSADQIDLDDSFSAAEWPAFDDRQDSQLVSISYDDDKDVAGAGGGEDWPSDEVEQRRWLYWRRVHYYISYAAMSANRIPCRPRSGLSYYNHNCNSLSAAVHPYFRSCSAITRCRR